MLGTEITTTYLQHVLQDASRKIRKQALSQYMFVCECEKCQRELGENKAQKSLKRGVTDDHESDDSSDDDY